MVKKRVGGAHRYKAVKAAAAAGQAEPQQQQKQRQQQDAGPKPPSHLQRKITKSVKFYEKVLASGAPKAPQGVQKKSTKKQRSSKTLASLDSLAAELSNIPAAGSSKEGGSSSSGSLSEQQAALLLRGKGTKSSIKRSRARLAVGVSESSRLQKVLQHPVYKSDPIQAVMNHLLNTLPAAPQQQQQRKQGAPGQQQQQQKQQQKRRKKSKQGGGAGGGVADMQD